jgi:RNA polymerase sigma-70 factor (ECF subfamily)
MTDDRQLVAAVLAQTPGAFGDLVERYQKLVWHLVYRMVQNTEHTHDLCQEAFLRVYRQLHQFQFSSALGTWIGSIAFSVAARHLRRRSLMLDDEADLNEIVLERDGREFDLAEACADAELLQRMHATIGALPPMQRLAITLHYLEEKGIGEIAEITNMPEGTIKSHLFRARLRLRQQLESLQELPL